MGSTCEAVIVFARSHGHVNIEWVDLCSRRVGHEGGEAVIIVARTHGHTNTGRVNWCSSRQVGNGGGKTLTVFARSHGGVNPMSVDWDSKRVGHGGELVAMAHGLEVRVSVDVILDVVGPRIDRETDSSKVGVGDGLCCGFRPGVVNLDSPGVGLPLRRRGHWSDSVG